MEAEWVINVEARGTAAFGEQQGPSLFFGETGVWLKCLLAGKEPELGVKS